MRRGLKPSKIDKGQFRLLSMIARKYNTTPEEILNSLMEDYNSIHVDELLSNDILYRRTISVRDLAKTLETMPEVYFLDIKYKNIKESQDSQIQTLDEALNEIH